MKWRLILIASVLLLALPSISNAENPTGNINFIVGTKYTADDFSECFDLDKRIELGFSSDVKSKNWPISIAFDYLFSYADTELSTNKYGTKKDVSADFYSTESYLGVKKIFELNSSVRPFVGAGIYTVSMYIHTSRDDEYDFGIGIWAGLGVYVMLSKHLDAGFAWKWSKAELNVFDQHLDAGGNHFDLMIGYHFF